MLFFLLLCVPQQVANTDSSVPAAVRPRVVAESSAAGLRVLRGRKETAAPVLDGRLDDPAWANASVATDFTQNYPQGGVPATRRTEARVLFAGDAIYVGMRAFDSPDSIIAPVMRRDGMQTTDMMDVLIDSYHDRRTAFHFAVNPAGVKIDMYHYDDVQFDMTWDAVWDVAVARDSLGWTAEFRIPLTQLRYSLSPDRPATWGINFYRNIARQQEWSSWAPVVRGQNREVSQFGELRSIDFLTATRRREITPYISSSVTRASGDATDPFFHANEFAHSAGFDAKFGLRAGLTLDLTVHPDFGQVEADPSEVNLSGFETTFQERRPFFVENGGLFALSIYESPDEVLFYPRRIGRDPQISVDTDGRFVREPRQTTILGAAKVSGKTSGGLSVGILDAVTQAEFADIIDNTNRASMRELVEPAANYGVLRVQQDLRGGKSTVGGMVTATNRFNLGTTASQLHDAAFAGGLDFRHRFGGTGGSDYEFFGALFGSAVHGTAAAIAETQRSSAHFFQRSDADHITYDTTRTSLTGVGGRLQFDRAAGRLRYGNAFYTRTPGFEINDLGIQKVADWSEDFMWVGTIQLQPNSVFNNWSIYGNTWSWWTYGGERTFTQFNVDLQGELRNFWGAFLRLGRRLPAHTLRLRGGPLLNEGGAVVAFGNFYSPQQKQLRINGSYSLFRSDDPGTMSMSFAPAIAWQPSSNATLTVAPMFGRDKSDIFYVAEASTGATPHYILGALNRTTTALTTRLDLAFSPALTLQLYAQPFLSAGMYSDYKDVVAPRARNYSDRFQRITPKLADNVYSSDLNGDGVVDIQFDNPAFNVREFRSNTVLRWEYRPGSTFFVVWSQGRHSDGDRAFHLSRDATELFRTIPENVLLLKMTRWMSF
ncbi:MAG TPA: DUF5916 domain-containing protein [Gemmatimonadaceae bacterium]|nr:DUF5916 domain-containing protein [Gemmatimonadaceae bacterium]